MRHLLLLVAGLLALAVPASADAALPCRTVEAGYGAEVTSVTICPPV